MKKRYKLLRELPIFKAGEILTALEISGWLPDRSMTGIGSEDLSTTFPDWFEEVKEEESSEEIRYVQFNNSTALPAEVYVAKQECAHGNATVGGVCNNCEQRISNFEEEAKECKGRGFILDPEYEVAGKSCFTKEGMEKASKRRDNPERQREPSDLIISAARKLEVAKTDFNAALIMSTLDFLDQELPKLLRR
mgnify:FL=1